MSLLVQGGNPEGHPATVNPVLVGVKDKDGNNQAIQLNDDGAIEVAVTGLTIETVEVTNIELSVDSSPVSPTNPLPVIAVGEVLMTSDEVEADTEFPATEAADGTTLIVFYSNPEDNKYYKAYSGEWREL